MSGLSVGGVLGDVLSGLVVAFVVATASHAWRWWNSRDAEGRRVSDSVGSRLGGLVLAAIIGLQIWLLGFVAVIGLYFQNGTPDGFPSMLPPAILGLVILVVGFANRWDWLVLINKFVLLVGVILLAFGGLAIATWVFGDGVREFSPFVMLTASFLSAVIALAPTRHRNRERASIT